MSAAGGRAGAARRRDLFFYGLFMDERILRERGVAPRRPRKAVVHGYRLRIANRALLVPQFGARAFGMVFALTERDITTLYAAPGLELYRPQAVLASFEDGTFAAVMTFNLHAAHATGEPDLEYAARLRVVFDRLGFPGDELKHVGRTHEP